MDEAWDSGDWTVDNTLEASGDVGDDFEVEAEPAQPPSSAEAVSEAPAYRPAPVLPGDEGDVGDEFEIAGGDEGDMGDEFEVAEDPSLEFDVAPAAAYAAALPQPSAPPPQPSKPPLLKKSSSAASRGFMPEDEDLAVAMGAEPVAEINAGPLEFATEPLSAAEAAAARVAAEAAEVGAEFEVASSVGDSFEIDPRFHPEDQAGGGGGPRAAAGGAPRSAAGVLGAAMAGAAECAAAGSAAEAAAAMVGAAQGGARRAPSPGGGATSHGGGDAPLMRVRIDPGAPAAAATTFEWAVAVAPPPRAAPPAGPVRAGGIVALPAPPRFEAPAPLDAGTKQQRRELHHLRTSLAAQLGGGKGGAALGPMAAQLRELARLQAAAAQKRRKHTPMAERGLAPESAWWDCLLDSLGLADVPLAVS